MEIRRQHSGWASRRRIWISRIGADSSASGIPASFGTRTTVIGLSRPHHAPWPATDEQQREQRVPSPRYPEDYVGIKPGYVKPASLAWYASHRHTADGLNQPYQYSYLFAYSIQMPQGTRTLTLPDNDKIRILAVSVAEENPELNQVQPLYDTLNRTEPPTSVSSSSRCSMTSRLVAMDRDAAVYGLELERCAPWPSWCRWKYISFLER